MTVDGLVTGMATTDMVSQLMKIEAMPQQFLKTKVGLQNKAVAAYQSVNTRLSSLASAAQALSNADAWGSVKTTSSSDAAAITAKPGATTGSLTFRVNHLAAAHTVTYSDPTKSVSNPATTSVLTGTTVDIKLADGTTKQLTPTGQSLQSVVSAINGEANAAYKAAAVQIEPGKYTLQLTAKKTGEDFAFGPPTGIDPAVLGAGNTTTLGTDAKLMVGTTASAYPITSTTNTFADVMPGVTVTAVRAQLVGDAPITVGVDDDPDGIASKVQALVDTANVVLSEITSQTRPKNGDVPAGPLVGDSALRKLAQDVLSSVSGGAGGLGSLSSVGVTLERSGKLSFDKTKFVAAYQADPAKTRTYFDSYTEVPHANANAAKFEPGWDQPKGLARKLEALSLVNGAGVILPTDAANKPKQGILQNLIERRNSSIRSLNEQVGEWDLRLARRKSGLEKQFGGMEVALGKLKQQSNWLAGQLATLS
jgi:flagellar hook-associated protein 2